MGTLQSTMSNPLESFLLKHKETTYIRFQWIDYTGMRRMRLVPVSNARKIAASGKHLAISKAVFSLCQNDFRTSDINVVGQWVLEPDWNGLRICPINKHASVFCNFRGDAANDQPDDDAMAVCPRTALIKALSYAKTEHDLTFLLGFETEFMLLDLKDYSALPSVHAWSSSVPLTPPVMACIDEIMSALQTGGVEVQYMHSEAAPGQFEIITGPLPPLEAIDTVYFTRATIQAVAYQHGFRATLSPLPFEAAAGTAAHTHMSVTKGTPTPESEHIDQPFFAGVLDHLSAVMALTMSGPTSFLRVRDQCWAGGTWNCWGDHNRETPIRRSSSKDRHWEIRCVDACANLYIALGGVIYAGCDGVVNNTKLAPACEVDPATLTTEQRTEGGIVRRLPLTLDSATQALEANDVIKKGLGETVVTNFVRVKEAEAKLFGGMDEQKKWRFLAECY
ncbi:hypothetical protein EDC01DRAFT_664086 [Geopyxis carbonaria]|nr:hypothetical protein EDC01DRAFT_664086 [Geopyxis carbonaria]